MSDEEDKTPTLAKINILAWDAVKKEILHESKVENTQVESVVEQEPLKQNTYRNNGKYYKILFHDHDSDDMMNIDIKSDDNTKPVPPPTMN